MSDPSWPRARAAEGFTLIEVIASLVIFSLGVLMVIQVSGALGIQMRYARARSEVVFLASEQVDSLEALAFSSLTAATAVDTLTIEGLEYERTVTVDTLTAVLKQIDVSFVPTGGAGPSHSVTSYTSEAW